MKSLSALALSILAGYRLCTVVVANVADGAAEAIPESIPNEAKSHEVAFYGTKQSLEEGTVQMRSLGKEFTVGVKKAGIDIVAMVNDLSTDVLFAPILDVNATRQVLPDVKITDVCGCPEEYTIFYNDRCHRDLEKVLKDAKGKTVFVKGTTIFKKPIYHTYDLTVKGLNCGGDKPRFLYNFENIPDTRDYSKRPDYVYSEWLMDGAMFIPKGDSWGKIDINFDNIEWTVDPENPSSYGSALQYSATGHMLDVHEPYYVSFRLTNCDFHDITSRGRGGMAVGFNTVHQAYIENCTFINNINLEWEDDTWNAGGAVWIRRLGNKKLDRNYFIMRNTTMNGNDNHFWHAFGGALYIEHLDDAKVDIEGHFENNTCSDGGAIHIAWIDKQSNIRIDGKFIKNVARSWDHKRNSARGAALKLGEINGKVKLTGEFIDNFSEGRGGVVASTRMYGNADVQLGGIFKNNSAWEAGAVWDQIYSNTDDGGTTGSGRMCKGAKFRILEGSWFEGNLAAATQFKDEDDYVPSIFHNPSAGIHLMEDEFMEHKKLKNKDVPFYCKKKGKCFTNDADYYWDDGDVVVKAKLNRGFPCVDNDSKFYKDNMYD